MKRAPLVRLVLLGSVVVAGSVAAWLLRDRLAPVLQWIHDLGFWGLVLLALAYLPAALVGFPPAILLTLAAGAFYDVLPGTVAISLGSTFAAAVAFLVGRTAARGWVEVRLAKQPLFKALDAAVAENGFKIVLLTRLSPLLPFLLLNYAYGLTRVKFRHYLLASWIGMAPGTVLYIYIGSTVKNAAELASGKAPDTGAAGTVLWWTGLAATLVVTFLVTRQARQALRRALKKAEDGKAPAPPAEPRTDRLIVSPLDEHNRRLLEGVHPADWKNPTPAARYHLVVVGAGPAGLVAAAGAAGLGARVALIERDLMGGDCLNIGCVPSKALLRCARAAADARAASKFGVRTGEIAVDFPAVMERLRRLRADLSGVDSAARFRGLGVDVFFGAGKFTGPDTVEVAGATVRFRRAVIAVGGRPTRPDIPGLEEMGYYTSDNIFNLTELPRRLAVVGAGPIGCELAQAFARFGSEVFLIGKQAQLLPREDADAAMIVAAAMERDGVKLYLGVHPLRAETIGADRVLSLSDGQEVRADAILVGAGRSPNVAGLGLEAAGVDYDAIKGVRVDDHLRTTNPHLFAAGDVCSRFQFTHAADAMARLVIQNALFFGGARVGDLQIPWCTYTDPEIAHVGLTAQEMKEKNMAAAEFVQELHEVDRAVLDGEEEGFFKVHVRKGTDRIVGATIVARHAGDMISEVTLAMAAKQGLRALGRTIHPYPTQAEGLRKVADAYNRTRLTPFVKGLFRRWFQWTR